MYKTFLALCTWQEKQPPILVVIMLPIWTFIVVTAIIRFLCWDLPIYMIGVMIGFWRCDECKQWFHLWKHGQSHNPDPFRISNTELCNSCTRAYYAAQSKKH